MKTKLCHWELGLTIFTLVIAFAAESAQCGEAKQSPAPAALKATKPKTQKKRHSRKTSSDYSAPAIRTSSATSADLSHTPKLTVAQLFSEVLVDPDDLSDIEGLAGWRAQRPGVGALSVWTREGNRGARKEQLVWAQAEEAQGKPIFVKPMTEAPVVLTPEMKKTFKGIAEDSLHWDGTYIGSEYVFDPLFIHSEGEPISIYLIRELPKGVTAANTQFASIHQVAEAYIARGFEFNSRGLTQLGKTFLQKGISADEVLAQAGNADAQFELGQFAEKGQGYEQDYGKASDYYEQAAKNRHSGAKELLKRPGFHEFVHVWQEAHSGHSPASERALAKAYFQGKDWVTQDFKEGAKWLNRNIEESRKAADKDGDADLQFALGVMYSQGYEVSADDKEAKLWLSKAESQGNIAAKEYLADLKDPAGKLNRKLSEYGIHVVALPGGVFRMGTPDTSDERRRGRLDNEGFHFVKLKPFFVMDAKVTRKQWQAITGEDPGSVPYQIANWTSCPDCPMTHVDWNDSKKLTSKLRDKGITSKLPTEAQQEYYMRGSYGDRKEITLTTYPWGTDEKLMDDYVWYWKNAGKLGKKVQSVGTTKIPKNSYGIKDALGNVWEWSLTPWNWKYPEAPTEANAVEDSGDLGVDIGRDYITRGCSWVSGARHCRPGQRAKKPSSYRTDSLGFRLVMVP